MADPTIKLYDASPSLPPSFPLSPPFLQWMEWEDVNEGE